jgi:hypothetical protein
MYNKKKKSRKRALEINESLISRAMVDEIDELKTSNRDDITFESNFNLFNLVLFFVYSQDNKNEFRNKTMFYFFFFSTLNMQN